MPKRKSVCVAHEECKETYDSSDDLFSRVSNDEIMNSKIIRHETDITTMFMSEEYSDCVLRVEGQKFPVNRSVLSVRSVVFRALFFGQMRESLSHENEVDLMNIRVEPFRHVLQFIYSSTLTLTHLSIELVIEILSLSQYLFLHELFHDIVNHLKMSLSMDNVFVVQKAANLYSIPELIRATNLFIDQNADQILSHKSFQCLLSSQLVSMLRRDSFYVTNEANILKSVCFWLKENNDMISSDEMNNILSSIRFWSIHPMEYKEIVRSCDIDLDFMQTFYEKQLKRVKKYERKHRGCLLLNQNVATPAMNAKVLKGRRRNKMINDSNRWYTQKACTSHSMGATPGDSIILVDLSRIFIINHMVLVLMDFDLRSYSYSIDVSIDRKTWKTVIDHSNYLCRSYQFLFFECQSVRYVRINGTKSMDCQRNIPFSSFDVLHFEVMYSTFPIEMDNNLVVKPKHNVFSNECKPFKSYERKVLAVNQKYETSETIDGKLVKQLVVPFERGSVCYIDDRSIYIQLCQPFAVNSLAFKLKNYNHFNHYRDISSLFSVQISTNPTIHPNLKNDDNKNWKNVSDFIMLSPMDGRIVSNFAEQVVVFIRIRFHSTPLPELESFQCPFNGLVNSYKRLKNSCDL